MGVWGRGLLVGLNLFVAVCVGHAATIYTWANSAGGSFQTAGNWSPSGVPVAGDTAGFDLSGSYTVKFSADAASDWLKIGNDTVTMQLEGKAYNVTREVQLGTASGNKALLTLSGGSLKSQGGRIGHVAGAQGTLTIDAATWTNENVPADPYTLSLVDVGQHGSGSLNVINGGTVSNDVGTIAASPGETGHVVVSGSGSQWNNVGTWGVTLDVGLWGTGTLLVEAGGEVTSGSGTRIGSHGNGAVAVTGAGSTLETVGGMGVGTSGTGRVDVLDGGTVRSGLAGTSGNNVFIGAGAAGVGEAVVRGADSTWTQGGDTFTVGQFGNGSLEISGGGVVESTRGKIGVGATAKGTVLISGSGSRWSVAKEFTVGGQGPASLRVEAGGLLENDGRTVIGDRTPPNNQGLADAIATVDGPGSRWIGADRMIVGGTGRGDLKIFNHAEVSGFRAASVGDQEGAVGFVHVNGSATWELSDYLDVGTGGHGIVFATNGSSLSAPRIHLGGEDTGYGYVYVGGTNAKLTTNSLAVGGRGEGLLTVQAAGTFSADSAILGDSVGAEGSVVIGGVGATWTSRTLDVGSWGQGNFEINDHGTASVQDFVRVGGHAGSDGEVTVNGPDAQMNVDGALTVGSSGTGRLEVSDGATAHTGRNGVSGNNVYVGGNGTGVGTVVIRGAGSSWTQDGYTFTLGFRGEGHLEITEGGSLESERGALGVLADAVGTAQVAGTDSRWDIRQRLVVGQSGEGVFNVEDGGVVQNDGTAFVGYVSGGAGTFTVAGAGSQWTSEGAVYVGESGDGALTVKQGALVTSNNGAVIGHREGSTGHVLVADAGSKWAVDGTIRVGDHGQGTLALADGAVVEATTVRVGAGGSLVGNGTVNADVTGEEGAVIAPGFSPGTLTINGDFTLDPMGILRMEIGGTGDGEYDRLVVNGDIFLDGGLEIAFVDGFLPTADMPLLDLITYDQTPAGDVFGDDFRAWVTGLAPGWEYELIVPATQGLLQLRSNSDGAPVPEPGTLVLFMSGLVGGGLVSRRRRHRGV